LHCTFGDITVDDQPRLEDQKASLKENDHATVLARLQPALEPPEVDDGDSPVRACWRDLSNPLDQLDDEGALEQGLPIGSDEIESAHRNVVQQRLKRPGCVVDRRPRRGHARVARQSR
jgi:hypothetical protein